MMQIRTFRDLTERKIYKELTVIHQILIFPRFEDIMNHTSRSTVVVESIKKGKNLVYNFRAYLLIYIASYQAGTTSLVGSIKLLLH